MPLRCFSVCFSVPPMFYSFLTPLLNKGEQAQYEFDGRNMDALQALISLLQYKLTFTTVSFYLYYYMHK